MTIHRQHAKVASTFSRRVPRLKSVDAVMGFIRQADETMRVFTDVAVRMYVSKMLERTKYPR